VSEVPESSKAEGEGEPAPSFTPAAESVSAGHYFRNLVLAGVALVIVCGAIIGFSSRDGDESSGVSTDADDELAVDTTTAPDPDEICIEEPSAWLPWVTGPGSTMDAAAEWGMQGEEYRIVVDGWSEFRRQVYQVGNDEASALAYGVIARGCRAMTYDYEPGHLPPG
jgi:hypothetical protein